MRIVIAGGHGRIALRLERLLAARGDESVALIRNPAHADDARAAGAEAVVADLEAVAGPDLAPHLVGADAVVFAAGAGPGSGTARKDTVDRAAAALLADAARSAGVERYLLVSTMGVERPPPPGADAVFVAYLRAKAEAEADLARRPLAWTILRPGRLTNEPGTGLVRLGTHVPPGAVPRDDVAAVLLSLLDHPRTARLTLELTGGQARIHEAIGTLLL
jgi:uncharacterized protein YbjT (DUF2867 family)